MKKVQFYIDSDGNWISGVQPNIELSYSESGLLVDSKILNGGNKMKTPEQFVPVEICAALLESASNDAKFINDLIHFIDNDLDTDIGYLVRTAYNEYKESMVKA